jgi:hypothetical protein
VQRAVGRDADRVGESAAAIDPEAPAHVHLDFARLRLAARGLGPLAFMRRFIAGAGVA